MKYDNYYEEVAKMTLNTSLEHVLYILDHYEHELCNEGRYNTILSRKDLENKFDFASMSAQLDDLDLFYNVLYVIVEKEKYLQNKYDYKSILIEKLSKKSVKKLEKIFVEKTGMDTVDYLKEVDKDLEKYFDNSKFEKKTWFTITSNKCALYHGELYYSDKPQGPIIYELSPELSIRGEKVVGENGGCFTSDDIDPKYIWVINEKKEPKPFWKVFSKAPISKSFSLVDKETGEVSLCPLSVPYVANEKNMPRRISNFILYPHKDPFSYDVYNSNYELIDKNVKYFNADYKNGFVLVKHIGQEKTQIRDGEYKEIGTINQPIIEEIINDNYPMHDERIYHANDGVVAINTGKRIVYYDYLNDKEIDNFLITDNLMRYSYFAYSEGLYNFINKDGLHGYKDINGNVVIYPNYAVSTPFLCNVASVFQKTRETYASSFDPNFFAGCNLFVIDKNGTKYSYRDVVEQIFGKTHDGYNRSINYFKRYMSSWWSKKYKIVPDFAKQMNRIIADDNTANLIGNEWYEIDNNTPIIETNFRTDEKVMEKK